jgi:hypothetical protein
MSIMGGGWGFAAAISNDGCPDSLASGARRPC